MNPGSQRSALWSAVFALELGRSASREHKLWENIEIAIENSDKEYHELYAEFEERLFLQAMEQADDVEAMVNKLSSRSKENSLP